MLEGNIVGNIRERETDRHRGRDIKREKHKETQIFRGKYSDRDRQMQR